MSSYLLLGYIIQEIVLRLGARGNWCAPMPAQRTDALSGIPS